MEINKYFFNKKIKKIIINDKESNTPEFSNFDEVSTPLKDDKQEIKQKKNAALKP